MFTSTSKVILEYLKMVAAVSLAGVIIGLLKSQPYILAVVFLALIIYVFYKTLFKSKTGRNWIPVVGMILTGLLGIIAEYWGVSNDHWQYYHIDSILPAWLPFAWMLAFYLLYRLEYKILPYLKNPSRLRRIMLMIFLTLTIPAFGEMVAINMDVWSYSWPYQILGVPVYAFIALVLLHMFVYIILYIIFKNNYGKMLPFNTAGSSS
ncbi:hypothetical protein [Nonlabens antarcticus]|uniref:hypothetical protein n=1 Tax=Nonlabens antarcticus TaxID=392714 RepID=UPI001890EB34|nr:hypothetical protein [Nonlabens antarcticus]